ncbi:N-acetyltransferase family protein [Dongia sp.]|uniref:GNAT family N-acetyltransferase n=1 Tax=Dongia sp. TaxID=1977262 RepID=UPI0035B01A5F
MTLAVRRARPADLPVCADIYIVTVSVTFPGEPATAAAFAESIVGEEQWVAILDGDIIGYISVYWPTNFIHSLYIHPEFQSRGAGRALLAEVRKLAEGDMELKTDKANVRAFTFYRRLGWRAVGEGMAASGPWWRLRWTGGRP